MGGYRRWLASFVAVVALSTAGAFAQDAQQPANAQRGQRGQFAGMQRVNGEVTAVAGSNLTIKAEDGTTYTVAATENTRVMRGQSQGKIADVKVGDGVMAAGNLDAPNKTLHALMIVATDAAILKQLKDNLGKTYIAGRVTAIDVDNVKMTIMRPDNVSQTIGFDETTSFKRGGGIANRFGANQGAQGTQQTNSEESITLADIKVGDNVTGQGTVKSGVFVPSELSVATPGARRNGAGRNPTTTPGTPPASTPQ